MRLTRATDVWSWAVSVLELFVGEPPCRYGQTAGQVLAQFLETGTREPEIPALPAGVAELLGRCFRLDPGERPDRMGEIADVLIEVYEDALGETWPRPRPDAARLLANGLSNQALSLLDLGHAAEAESLLEQALLSDPLNPHAVYNAGLHRWRSGRASDAALVAELEAVRASDPADPTAAHLLGLVHLERGDREAARKALTDAARQAPTDPDITAALALAQHPGEPPLPSTLPAGSVNAVALSGDGQLALSAGGVDVLVRDQTMSTLGGVRAWEVRTGRQLCRLAGREFTSVALSADGSRAVSGSSDGGSVRVWELRSGRCVFALEGHDGAVRAVALSADGSVALSGGDDATVRAWNLATGRCVHTLRALRRAVLTVAMSADARRAASGAADGTLRVWDLASGRCLRVIDAHPLGVSSVAMSADGRVAVSCYGTRGGRGDPIVRVWDLTTGRCLQALEGHARGVLSVAVGADASIATSVSIDGTARLWDLATGRCLRVLNVLTDGAASVAISADGSVAVYGAASRLCRDDVHSVGVWDLRAGPRSPWSYSRPRPATELDRTALAVQDSRRRRLSWRGRRD